MTISERMFFILDRKNLKSVDLANLLDVGTGQISTWKKRNTDPPAKYIPLICEFLGISYEYLLLGNDEDSIISIGNTISHEDKEWLSLIHQLPPEAQYEFRGEIRGYLKHLNESVAADSVKLAK